MNPLLNSKYGCWIVDRKIFLSKIQALEYASKNKSLSVSFYYHNHIWENFDHSLLGKIPLKTLYKQRAQQLRDTYDHLVLHYSGGSDSHNILDTFLNNNIKLDEIAVHWAKPLVDGKFYTPNNQDRSARNAPSEWNYTIKPALEKISREHPNIKINVVDFTEGFGNLDLNSNFIENLFDNKKLYVGALGTISRRIDQKLEFKVTSAKDNKKIGHIFGVEKPLLSSYDGNINMIFRDSNLEVAVVGDAMQKETIEMFYWTPDLPLLPMEQAYQLALFFKNKQDLLYQINGTVTTESKNLDIRLEMQKQILYADSWDLNKFQVNKPNSIRSDWWFWLYESPELSNLQKTFDSGMKNISTAIDKKYLNCDGLTPILASIKSKSFLILKV